MGLKQQIDKDLKTAMLGGDKVSTTTLRGLKSVILDQEIHQGAREQGLSDDAIQTLLAKELKKRHESLDFYEKAQESKRAEQEKAEIKTITSYLPTQLSESEVAKLVDEAIESIGKDLKNMGQIIGSVKSKAKGAADGALVAKIAKERLQT